MAIFLPLQKSDKYFVVPQKVGDADSSTAQRPPAAHARARDAKDGDEMDEE